ncbi:MAG TPA: cytochrome C oxidase subunit IV family protein [Candidatus Binatia bacterium]
MTRDDHAAASTAHDHVVPLSVYFGIFATLLVLTGVTTAVAFVDLGRMNVFVALTIAVVKASLVLLYFMHLRYTARLTPLMVAIAFFWLAIMIVLTMADFVSRGWFTGLLG